MDSNTTQFFAHVLDTARRNLPYAPDATSAARAALQEAHSSLSQAAFFAALDALGGQQAIVERLETALLTQPPPAARRDLTRNEMAAYLKRSNPDIDDTNFTYWLDACMQAQAEPRERIPW